jgi:hypothetical protein
MAQTKQNLTIDWWLLIALLIKLLAGYEIKKNESLLNYFGTLKLFS